MLHEIVQNTSAKQLSAILTVEAVVDAVLAVVDAVLAVVDA